MVVALAVLSAVSTGLAAVSAAAAVRFYLRSRRMAGVSLEAVNRLLRASQVLREGLSPFAADRIVGQLHSVLDCVAVGITDADGRLLSWDGEANEHYIQLHEPIIRSIVHLRSRHVNHDKLPCQRRGNCPMRTAVVVPLVVENSLKGVLVVVGGVDGKRLIRMADQTARLVCTQLELAQLDESRQQLAQAEVRALRAQMSPHFLYNALNTIAELIRTDPEKAEELVIDFADCTRYSFRTSRLFTTLAEELRNVDRYLTLENAHYGDRLQVRLQIDPGVLFVTVPFLVLQPLVENAVRHGLAKKPGGGTITVVAQDNGTEALISVEDDGVGMDADRLADLRDAHRSGAHVGIGNINQRMRSVYGEEYALIVETAPGAGMKVILRVPKFLSHQAPLPSYLAS